MGSGALGRAAGARDVSSFDPSAYRDLLEREGRHFWFRAWERPVGALLRHRVPRHAGLKGDG